MKKLEPGSVGESPPVDDALERLFSSAREDGLRGGQFDELWSRVGPAALGGGLDPKGGTGGAGGAGASATATSAIGVKTIAALLVGGSLVAGGLAHPWRASQHPPVAPVTASAPAQVVSPAAPSPASDPQVAAPDPGPQAVPVGALPLASSAVRPSSRTRSGAPAAIDARPVDRTLARRFPDEDSPGSVWSGSVSGNPSPAGGAASPAPDPRSGGAPQAFASTPRAPNEGALLLRARQELASNPAGVLALTDEHARRFPGGSLVPEREVLAIEALARLGRMPEASARLAAFRERFPQSPHLARLDALVDH